MTLDNKKLGKVIKALRISRKMSQAELAELTDLSVPFISHIETGRSKASLETIVKIAGALKVNVDRLLIGNQAIGSSDYESEISDLFSDCNLLEKELIFSIIKSLKEWVHSNIEMFFKK